MYAEIVELVLQFKRENPHWGHTRIRDDIVYLGYRIGETTSMQYAKHVSLNAMISLLPPRGSNRQACGG
jgi:hypothetical protein